MSEQIGSVYKIRGEDPGSWVGEVNKIFELISSRLDNIEGYRGHLKVYNYVEAMSDVVVVDSTKGIVLKDNGNPSSYWRVTIESSGTVTVTNIGSIYP